VSYATAVILLVGRILFVVMFVMSARGHVFNSQMLVKAGRSRGAPLPYLGGWPVGVWMLLGSISLVLGIFPDIGALMLAAWLPLPSIFIHAWWKIEDPAQRRSELMSFNRNITLLGASLALFACFVALGHGLKLTLTGPLLHF
jgi:putative oxidoreductase